MNISGDLLIIFFWFSVSTNFHAVEPSHLNTTLHQWVNEERFLPFPKVGKCNSRTLDFSQTSPF